MSIRSIFTGAWWKRKHPADPYMGLALTLLMLLCYILSYFIGPPGHDEDLYKTGVLVLMLLFNSLDGLARERQFWWPTWLVATLKILPLVWGAFGLFYLAYWSHVLYPSPPRP